MIPFLFSFGVTAQIILMPWKVSYTSVVVILWTTFLGDNCRDIMDDIIGRQLSWYYGWHYWENTEKTLIHLHLVTAVNFYLEKNCTSFSFFNLVEWKVEPMTIIRIDQKPGSKYLCIWAASLICRVVTTVFRLICCMIESFDANNFVKKFVKDNGKQPRLRLIVSISPSNSIWINAFP